MKTIFTTTDISDKLTQALDNSASLNAKIVAQMHQGVAHFYFTKKDGSIREAYGTLEKSFLTKLLGEQEQQAQAAEPIPNSDQLLQKYWDIEAGGFRSFTIANLVCMF